MSSTFRLPATTLTTSARSLPMVPPVTEALIPTGTSEEGEAQVVSKEIKLKQKRARLEILKARIAEEEQRSGDPDIEYYETKLAIQKKDNSEKERRVQELRQRSEGEGVLA